MKPVKVSIERYYKWLKTGLLSNYEAIQKMNRPDLNLLWQKFKLNPIESSQEDLIQRRETELIDQSAEYLICGSYRRGCPDSGDVDILIKSSPTISLGVLVKLLQKDGFMIGTLAQGEKKFLGIGKLDDQHNARRIDLLMVEPESWAYATLYFTGSQKLNILMRNRAIEKNLTLNEYGLFNSMGQNHPAQTEQEIFRYLDLEYLNPSQRNL
jgi:DNA polymerase/3'-5' exonuclease PolX